MADESTPGRGDGASRETAPKKPWREMSPDELVERIDAYHAEQLANRRRITGDDVQEMLRERRVRRRELRRERAERRGGGRAARRDAGRVARLSLGGALMVGAIGTGALAASSTDATEARSEANDREVALLEGEIRALEAEAWDEEETAAFEERLSEAVAQARGKGDEVADLQNTYQEILVDLDDVGTSGNSGGNGAFAAMVEHRSRLVDYFDESARIIEDEESYGPGADVPYGPGEVDVLFPWYVRYADENRSEYSDAALNSWELAATTPRSGSPGTVSVAWLNRDESSGELLAWAQGTYSADTGRFHSLHVGLTTIGELPVNREASVEGGRN